MSNKTNKIAFFKAFISEAGQQINKQVNVGIWSFILINSFLYKHKITLYLYAITEYQRGGIAKPAQGGRDLSEE